MKKGFDLKKYYPHILQLALIIAQLVVIGALKFNLPDDSTSGTDLPNREEVNIELPPITQTIEIPPAPDLAPVPAAIPDDSPIDSPPLDFGSFDDIPTQFPLPPHDEKSQPDIIEQAEFMPKMEGGIKALYGEINYPEEAKRSRIEGMVVVEFVVDKKGEVVDPKVVRSIGGGCDEEVLRAIKLQSFSPGVQNGKLVKVKMRQVVHFRLR